MESTKVCEEYICGCCLYEEFATIDVTDKCPKSHNIQKRKIFRNNMKTKESCGYIRKAIITYEEIIKDTDQKIKDFTKSIKPTIPKKIINALDYTEKCVINEQKENVGRIYSLLNVHGKLIQESKKAMVDNTLKICKNCGSFLYGTNQCKHKFCKSYLKIRKLLEELKEIIKGREGLKEKSSNLVE
ncbi:hypothetical protein EHP00_2350 [Ecytonucleospora hepatopenaei]|uniref:Uncharacterized protein n=1 Tax=Ecytonucleospora hepatopenaei TaxID=646526 RepID=A0A1W0E9G4_9MICR|nr:hypothetical protein EHP00_2350 [Ecytonucleospora hepatopenaei]